MTPNEIQTLIVGIALGAQSTNIVHMILDVRAQRRSDQAARGQRRINAADLFLSTFRVYRLQHRSPV